ncbi:MAG: replication-associated recombination protein A [Candidatus Aminicenantia bacterium]
MIKQTLPPLAERMRPRSLEELYGQEHLTGKGKILDRIIENKLTISLIFWGPPGSGKTSIARILAEKLDFPTAYFSAVLSGIKEVKQVMESSQAKKRMFGKPTIIFIDEIHRFNKAQQDAFLPYVEKGDIIFYGSTTENPSFEIISPLLSRVEVVVLKPLEEETLRSIAFRALEDRERGLGNLELKLEENALQQMIIYSNKDARRLLNFLEISAQMAVAEGSKVITTDIAKEAMQKRVFIYDRAYEEHYNLISALHKSLRNSDVDSSLYWLVRMLKSGEDPLYIARRLIRFAMEDIGLADPNALAVALNAKDAYDFIGSPEGELALAEAVIYLASAPKSNSVYRAYGSVSKDVEETVHEPVPLHLRNPVTPLMRKIGYGNGYFYAHNIEEKTTAMETLPESLKGRKWYEPGEHGFEREIKKRIEWWNKLKEKIKEEEES